MKNNEKRRYLFPLLLSLLVIVIVFVSFYLGNKAALNGLVLGKTNLKVQGELGEIKDTEKYNKLLTVRDAIYKNYDGNIDDNKLLDGAIKGMTEAVGDKYTVYMNEEDYKEFNKEHSGEFMGIGVMISPKEGMTEIASVVEGSPAEKSGLKSGDIIVKINGETIKDDTEKAANLIKGKRGEEVTLTIRRKGEKSDFDVKIKRDIIKTDSVKGEIIDGNIGYIRLSTFAKEGVGNEFIEEVNNLLGKGMKGMILDLRGNPGGFLSEAVKIASQFIPKGETITYTIDKYDNKSYEKSIGDGRLNKMPVVLLVDKGSASASELLTMALRDYKIATIVGTNTYGKGVVQAPIEFKDGSALKVTISRYYSPNGLNINEKGIEPDVKVELSEEFLNKPYNRKDDPQFNEALKIMKKDLHDK